MSLHSDEDDSTQYLHIPTNRPIVTLNDAFAHLVKASVNQFHIDSFYIDMKEGTCYAECNLRKVNEEEPKKFIGASNTLNDALRDMLDQVNETYQLGGEYESPFPE